MSKIDDQNKEKTKVVKKSFFKKAKHIDKSEKPVDAPQISIIGQSAPDTAVVIKPQSKHSMRLSVSDIVKTTLFVLIASLACLIIVFCSVNHIVNIPVNGSNITPIQNTYYVSKEYQPDTSNLNAGDKVYQMSLPSWIPIQFNPKVYTYKSRFGNILHVTDQYGHSKDIEANEVDFIRG